MSDSAVRLNPQLVTAFEKAREIDAQRGPAGPGIASARERAALNRLYWNEGGPAISSVEPLAIPGRVRDVPAAIYRPAASVDPLPVFVFLHGGGFKIGNEWANDRQMREIAAAWGGAVISADYLHVPEHVFPAAVDEIAEVLQWLHDEGEALGLDADRIGFGGTSAGACIAFGAAARLGGVAWLKAAVGIVGAFNFDTTTSSMQQFGNAGLFPSLGLIQPMLEDYVRDPAARNHPCATPTSADPTLFPPTFLAAAEYDVFRDASALMAVRLQEAGRLHSSKIYPGMAHLFFGFSREVECAAICVRDVADFLAELLPVARHSA